MNTIHQFIAQLGEHDIKLRYDNDRLQVNAPKGAMTQELAAQIKARKEELLAFLKPTEDIPLVPVSRDQALPLSFSQQRLWFLHQLDGESAVYNVPCAYLLEGDFSIETIKTCFRQIVARHEVLRTSFAERDGQPFQVIDPNPELDIPVMDISKDGLDDQALNAEIERLVHEETHRPFDLGAGPILRVRLVVPRDRQVVLILTMHHIVADGWSMDILVHEFAEFYRATLAGEEPVLPELPVQYADFAHWQRRWLKGERLDQQANYWRNQLEGLPPLLELPLDASRSATQSFEGSLIRVRVPEHLVAALGPFCREQGLTSFVVMMAVFNLLMARLSGSDDISVGSPISNRDRADLSGLIGYFSNTLILRTQVSPQSSFHDICQQVNQRLMQAYDSQGVPFGRLVDILKPERSMSYSPLFQVMFTLRKPLGANSQYDNWKMSLIDHGALTSKFDLTLNLTEDEDGIYGFMEYSKVCFKQASIERWFDYFLVLLEQALKSPQEKVSGLPILPVEEKKTILETWNDTQQNFSAPGCIHTAFEAQVLQSPDDCAVVYDASTIDGEMIQLSFKQLNEQANRLAHYLIGRGVGPDDRVALCLPRSLEMVVGMLGILKAGAAYVPLDPAYPQERLAYMLEDAGIEMVISNPAMYEILPDGKVEMIHLNEALLAGQPDHNPNVAMTPDNLLYVIYTSGSTGQPKGIALAHDALVNLIYWHLQDLTKPGGVLQFASMSFDASYHEIFAAWLAGNTLYLIPEELRYDTASLPALLAKHRVAKVILPVVVLQQWAEFYPDGSPHLQYLRDIITTGEQLQVTRPIVALFKTMPEARLHNHYGPAETHVVTAYSFGTDPDSWTYHAPIGTPVFNSSIYILDDNLEPVPTGVKGHLYIGGTHLARGYLGKPKLTADRFVPSPFQCPRCTPDPASGQWTTYDVNKGDRLYKTGDLARYLDDGNIEFLGRSDHMVKLRGFRIEPAEIEDVLTRDPRVNRAVIVMRGDTDKRLIAYLILNEPIPKLNEALRDLVAKTLPEFMIPSAFVIMDKLPLSPAGKVDTRKLPDPDFSLDEEDIVEPRSPMESQLRDVWAQVLGLEANKISVFHNFFTLGGHSLLATRVVSRLRVELEVDLPLRTLFSNPTIASLAAELENILWLKQGQAAGLEDDGEGFEEEL